MIAPVAANFLLLALVVLIFDLTGLHSYDHRRSWFLNVALEILYYLPFVLVNLVGLAAAALTRRWIMWGGLVTAGLAGVLALISLIS